MLIVLKSLNYFLSVIKVVSVFELKKINISIFEGKDIEFL
jgi:hypothetical protein